MPAVFPALEQAAARGNHRRGRRARPRAGARAGEMTCPIGVPALAAINQGCADDQRQSARTVSARTIALAIRIGGLLANIANNIIARLETA
jgi:hypothetical protein